ncbi:hypothetical protein ANN_02324 [Periplaneta americana]|uniref:Reverse transcriptase domain-containing protein n=1 Tax=Periplaneta americana TaxID=6978 RepID=A0ABQ8TXL3_PERAM|nr:hypothetical protein ANN_02324 [Periplaneta americana]
MMEICCDATEELEPSEKTSALPGPRTYSTTSYKSGSNPGPQDYKFCALATRPPWRLFTIVAKVEKVQSGINNCGNSRLLDVGDFRSDQSRRLEILKSSLYVNAAMYTTLSCGFSALQALSGKDLGRCLNISALSCPHRKNRRVQGLVIVLARGRRHVKKLSVRETSVSGLGEKSEPCERWLRPAETMPGNHYLLEFIAAAVEEKQLGRLHQVLLQHDNICSYSAKHDESSYPGVRLGDKLSRLGIDKRVVLWIREFLNGRTQRVRVGHEISEIGNISSGVPQGSVLGPLLFIIYVNDLCQNITSNMRLFADDCIIYRKIRNNSDVDAIQTDLNKIYNWALKHRMKINGSKSKSITFCKTREETSLNYEFSGVVIPQEQCCKYLGVYLNSKLSWGEHVDNVTGKAWRALHFIMRILRKASPKSREIAYLTLVRPLMEYGTTCWDPYRIYQINSLERIQYRAAKFVKAKREDGNDTIKELKWETLENRRRKIRITSLYRAHLGQKAWVDITARLEKPTYYGRNDHDFKIKYRKQKTDVDKNMSEAFYLWKKEIPGFDDKRVETVTVWLPQSPLHQKFAGSNLCKERGEREMVLLLSFLQFSTVIAARVSPSLNQQDLMAQAFVLLTLTGSLNCHMQT